MRYLSVFAALSFAAVSFAQSTTYIINTSAGNGAASFTGDGSIATGASLNYPVGIALASDGSLYIADTFNQRIRRVAPDGTITTVAGNGSSALAGDGGAATSASFFNPCGIAVDGAGNIYIADTRNHVVRRIQGSNITKIAGTGEAAYSGDGGPANEATLNTPTGLALDRAGNLYIADTLNSRIRRISTSGTISTFAGNGVNGYDNDLVAAPDAALQYPQGIAVDADGNVYIADTFNDRIRRVGTDGIIDTVAGNGVNRFAGDRGPAINASLNYPKAVALDGVGNLFIVDSFNSRIRRVNSEGIITTIAGNGMFAGFGDTGVATRAAMRFPSGIAVGPAGLVFVSDTDNSRIRVLVPEP
jgi:sugar lactone lactonase YvrE